MEGKPSDAGREYQLNAWDASRDNLDFITGCLTTEGCAENRKRYQVDHTKAYFQEEVA
jgi:hypothetical protein